MVAITHRTDAMPGAKPSPSRPDRAHGLMAALFPAGSDRLRQWLPLATLILLVALVGALQPVFLQPATLLELAGDTAVLFILATGVTFVIMLGGIDLSIQSMASLASVVVAITLSSLGYWSFVLAVALGGLAGLLSGLAHTRLRIPSFIATLAMGGVLFSTALVTSRERSITLQVSERGYLEWVTGSAFGMPNVVVIGIVVLTVAHVLQAHTRFGRYSAAIGAGEPATYASGVKVNRQKVIAFVLSGGFAALGRGDPGRSARQRLADARVRNAAAVDCCGDRRRNGDYRRRRQHLADTGRRADHLGGADRDDVPRRQYLRPEHRLRRGADRGRRHHHRPLEDSDRQVVAVRRGRLFEAQAAKRLAVRPHGARQDRRRPRPTPPPRRSSR